MKITEIGQIWSNFLSEKITLLKLTKYGLGYILGDFFTIASGQPGRRLA
jgi:hypothetical protein